MRIRFSSTVLTLAGILSVGSDVRAQGSVSLTPLRDTSIYEDHPTRSAGMGQTIFAGNNQTGWTRRALVAFDVAGAIPPGATILSATLTMEMLRTQALSQAVDLQRVTSDWGQGTSGTGARFPGGGRAAEVDDATWLNRFACDQSLTGTMSVGIASTNVTGTGTLFTTELSVGDLFCIGGEGFGVMQITNDTTMQVETAAVVNHVNDPGLLTTNTWTTAGGDFAPGVSASTAVAGVGSYNWSSAGMVSDVQAWLDDPASNFGWIVRSDESAIPGAKAFAGLENPSATVRPTLVIEFAGSAVPTLPEWGSILFVTLLLGTGSLILHRRQQAGREPA